MPTQDQIEFNLKGSALQNLTTSNQPSQQSTPRSAVSEVSSYTQSKVDPEENSQLLQGHALSKIFDELNQRMNKIEMKYLTPLVAINKQILDNIKKLKDGVNSRLETINKQLLQLNELFKKVFADKVRLLDEAQHGDKSVKVMRMISGEFSRQLNKMKELYLDPKSAQNFNLQLMGYLSKKNKVFARLFDIEEKEERVGRKPAVFTLQLSKVIENIPNYLNTLSNNITRTMVTSFQQLGKLITDQRDLQYEELEILTAIRDCTCALTDRFTVNPTRDPLYKKARDKEKQERKENMNGQFRRFFKVTSHYYEAQEHGQVKTIEFQKDLLKNTANLKSLTTSMILLMFSKSSMFWKTFKLIGAFFAIKAGSKLLTTGPIGAITTGIVKALTPMAVGLNNFVKKTFPNFHETISKYFSSTATFLKKYVTGEDKLKNWGLLIFGAIVKAWTKVIGPAISAYIVGKKILGGAKAAVFGTPGYSPQDSSPEAERYRRIQEAGRARDRDVQKDMKKLQEDYANNRKRTPPRIRAPRTILPGLGQQPGAPHDMNQIDADLARASEGLRGFGTPWIRNGWNRAKTAVNNTLVNRMGGTIHGAGSTIASKGIGAIKQGFGKGMGFLANTKMGKAISGDKTVDEYMTEVMKLKAFGNSRSKDDLNAIEAILKKMEKMNVGGTSLNQMIQGKGREHLTAAGKDPSKYFGANKFVGMQGYLQNANMDDLRASIKSLAPKTGISKYLSMGMDNAKAGVKNLNESLLSPVMKGIGEPIGELGKALSKPLKGMGSLLSTGIKQLGGVLGTQVKSMGTTIGDKVLKISDSVKAYTSTAIKTLPKRIGGKVLGAAGRMASGLGMEGIGESLQMRGAAMGGIGGPSITGGIGKVLGVIGKMGTVGYIAGLGIYTLYTGLKEWIFPMFTARQNLLNEKGEGGGTIKDQIGGFVKGLVHNAFNLITDGIKNLPDIVNFIWEGLKGALGAIFELIGDGVRYAISAVIDLLPSWMVPDSWIKWAHGSDAQKFKTDAEKEKKIQLELEKKKIEDEKKQQAEQQPKEEKTGLAAIYEKAAEGADSLGSMLGDIKKYFKGDFKKDMMKVTMGVGKALGSFVDIIKGMGSGMKGAASGLMGGVAGSLKSFYTGFFGDEGKANSFFDNAIQYAESKGYTSVAGFLKQARGTSVKDVLESSAAAQVAAANTIQGAGNKMDSAADKIADALEGRDASGQSAGGGSGNKNTPPAYVQQLDEMTRRRIDALDEAERELRILQGDLSTKYDADSIKQHEAVTKRIEQVKQKREAILSDPKVRAAYAADEQHKKDSKINYGSFERGQGQSQNTVPGSINSNTPPASTNSTQSPTPGQPTSPGAVTNSANGGQAAKYIPTAVNSEAALAKYMVPTSRGISSQYGPRIHPVHKTQSFHNGIDIRAAVGSPITAPLGGKVLSAREIRGGGYTVEIFHPQANLVTRYMHLSRFGVSSGQEIAAGTVIGYVGGQRGMPGAGTSTGPHLHFEVDKPNWGKLRSAGQRYSVAPTSLVAHVSNSGASTTEAAGGADDYGVAKLRTDFGFKNSAAKMISNSGMDAASDMAKNSLLADVMSGNMSNITGTNNVIVVNGGSSLATVNSKSANNGSGAPQTGGNLMNYYLGVV